MIASPGHPAARSLPSACSDLRQRVAGSQAESIDRAACVATLIARDRIVPIEGLQ